MKKGVKSNNELLLEIEKLQKENKAHKAASEASLKAYMDLMESSPNGIAIHQQGKLVFVNTAGMQLIGADKAEDILGRPIMEFVHPELKPMVSQRIQDLIKSKSKTDFKDEKFIRLDGSTIDVAVLGIPTTWEGEPAVQVLFSDLSPLIEWEADFALYKHMVANSTDMLALLDTDFVFRVTNKQYAKAFNSSQDELVGTNISSLFGTDIFNTLIKPQALKCLQGENVKYQSWFEFPAYGKRYMEVTYYPHFDKHNKVIGYVANGRDITEEKKVEHALYESENKYRTLFEQTADATLIIEGNTFIDCNQATVEMLGYKTKNELLQVHPSKLSPKKQPDGRNSFEKANEMISTAYEKGSHRFEWLHQKQNGEVFPVEVLLTAVPLGEGKFLHVVWRDISERKLAEQTIKASEARLNEAQQLANIGDFTWNIITNEVSWSKGMYTLLKYDENEKINLSKVNEKIHHPDDLERVNQWFGDCIKSGKKKLTSYDYRLIRKDGKTIFVHTEGNITYKNGIAISVFGMCKDITEAKESEAKIKNLIDLEKEKSLQLEESLNQLQHAQDASLKIMQELNEEINERKAAEKELKLYRTKLEQLVDSRTKDLKKSQESLTLLLEDMNESREELAISNKKLASLNSDLETFAYSISHDLRAPLRHIGGFAALLEKNLPGEIPIVTRYFEKITDSVIKMSAMIDALLSFSRLGRKQIQRSTVDLKDLAGSTINRFKPEWQGKNLSWKIGDLPIVSADPKLLQMVFDNLISNAIKFTGKVKKPTIVIDGGSSLAKPCDFFIKDNGAGFDPQYSNKLFEVFQRLHSKDEFEGTGIGLANVKQIIQKHGGSIWADGVVGKGATFFVNITD